MVMDDDKLGNLSIEQAVVTQNDKREIFSTREFQGFLEVTTLSWSSSS